MEFSFDSIIERRGTDSIKFDSAVRRGKPEGILPFWVADMDFPAPDCVLQELTQRVQHGIFGYSEPMQDYFDALEGWFTGRFGYSFDPQWVVQTPGIVYAICTAIRALTSTGDSVLIQEPVYYPFKESVLLNNRKLAVNELVLNGDTYEIDFIDFERQITENKVALFILCSPHNPVGRVWREDELEKMANICKKHGVLIISDEIHCDFVYSGYTHHALPTLVPEYQDSIIYCTAPSKTFNLAGLQISNIFISNGSIRQKFLRELESSGYSQPSALGLVACRAAYNGGGAWLNALLDYLEDNLTFTHSFLKKKLPAVGLIPPEGTYLLWLDCRRLNLDDHELNQRIVDKGGLWLDRGDMFGPAGGGFQRINAACPRAYLETGLAQLAKALG